MESAYQETNFILKKYKISASKSLGQNFLIDDEVIDTIVASAGVCKDDLVIEIGPGLGTLTKRLLDNAKKVIAIELDKRMIEILEDRFSLYDNFELINDDVLKVNLNEIIKDNKEKNDIKNVKIVANLPYYITTPIVMKLLEENLNIESITVMVQKEVAKRLTAKTGSRLSGAITYAVEYYSVANEVCDVSKECFIPSPQVDSEVIKLTLRTKKDYEVKNEEKLFDLIKYSFMQRRKTFVNGISNSNFIDKEKLLSILDKLNISDKVRGEELTLIDFINISNEI